MSSKETVIRRILTIDGGGIRGVIPAKFLSEYEKATGQLIADQFDLIAGTSTGGLIALALSLRIEASKVVDLYTELGKSVFGKPRFGSLFVPKYDINNLSRVLVSILGDKKLGDATTRLLIPSYDLSNKTLYIYKTAHHPRLRVDYKEKMIRVACSTAAAPSYFEAYSEGTSYLVDGGIWANNPTGLSMVEAQSLLDWGDDDVRVLSLGCGGGSFDFPRAGGKLSMILALRRLTHNRMPPLISLMMKGQSDQALGTARLLLNHSADRPRLFRLEPMSSLVDKSDLDDYRSISKLIKASESLVKTNLPAIISAFNLGSKEPFIPCYTLDDVDTEPPRHLRVPL